MPFPFLSSLFSTSSSNSSSAMAFPVQKTDDEWRAVLSPGKPPPPRPRPRPPRLTTAPEQFRILRQAGTEAPHSGPLDGHFAQQGAYTCAGCAAPLYRATHKFSSGCGWPAFFDAVPGAVVRRTDRAFGMERTEIVCGNCGGHLGHVFKGEGYPTSTDERHCVNSVSIKFDDKAEAAAKDEAKTVEAKGETAKV
jgi:peptide-methionine (R)-S-oxide reductase